MVKDIPFPLLSNHTPKKQARILKKEIDKLIKQAISPIDKPATNITIEKSINGINRLNALIRIPEIQKELDTINKETERKRKLKLRIEFFNKYDISSKVFEHPDKFYKAKHYFDRDIVEVLSNYEKDNLKNKNKYRDRKYIIVAVNMSKKKAAVVREFKNEINRIWKYCHIPKETQSRDRDFTIDNIWEIYDYHTKNNLNFSQIAKRLSGVNKNPTYNKTVRSYYMRVRRAYKRAMEIMQIVRNELKQKGLLTNKHT